MYTETVTYTDYNGSERTESFSFNLTKAEVYDTEMSYEGGYKGYLQKIVDAKDMSALVKVFKELLMKTYGERSSDGRRFIKSPELSKAFSETEAFSTIYIKLATDADAAAKFISGTFPKTPIISESSNSPPISPPQVQLLESISES